MTSASSTVLIAEAHPAMRSYLADNLQADGYWPLCAADSGSALELLDGRPDVLLVDVNGQTLGVVDAIREERRSGVDPLLPIMVLTSDPSAVHRTRLYERGDDVLLKPFSYSELRARLGALLRRAHARRAPRLLRAGSLRLDAGSRRVWVSNVEIPAPPGKEYELLVALIAEPERVFTNINLGQT